MTPDRWMVAGWTLIAGTVLLAVVSATEAFVALHPAVALPQPLAGTTVSVTVLMRAVVLGVLAGAAFFAGLACFFWSAAQRRRLQLDQILRRLEARTDGAS